MRKTIVELDLVGYSDEARELEEQLGLNLIIRYNDQNQGVVDAVLPGRSPRILFFIDHSALRIPHSVIENLAAAVDGLRDAGESHYLPRGLLTRAWQRQLTGDASGAAADLDEAWEIAERGPMPLYQADILLTRARLFGRMKDEGGRMNEEEYPWGSAREDLTAARRLIEKHGYHRRDEELEDAEAALLNR